MRQPGRHVADAGMAAVHGAEAVTDIQLGQRRQLARERTPDGVVLARLTGVETQVFQHQDLTGLQPGRG